MAWYKIMPQSHTNLWSPGHVRLRGKCETLYSLFQGLRPAVINSGGYWWETLNFVKECTNSLTSQSHVRSRDKRKMIQLNFWKVYYNQTRQVRDLQCEATTQRWMVPFSSVLLRSSDKLNPTYLHFHHQAWKTDVKN